jgi:hypothetical protein
MLATLLEAREDNAIGAPLGVMLGGIAGIPLGAALLVHGLSLPPCETGEFLHELCKTSRDGTIIVGMAQLLAGVTLTTVGGIWLSSRLSDRNRLDRLIRIERGQPISLVPSWDPKTGTAMLGVTISP